MEVMKSVWRWWWWGLASYEIGGFTGTGRKKRHRHCSLRVWHWAQCLRNDEIAEEEEVYWQLQASLSHLSVTVLRQIKTSTTTTALSPSIKSVSCARHLVVVVVVVSPHCCWSLPKASGLKCVCVCVQTLSETDEEEVHHHQHHHHHCHLITGRRTASVSFTVEWTDADTETVDANEVQSMYRQQRAINQDSQMNRTVVVVIIGITRLVACLSHSVMVSGQVSLQWKCQSRHESDGGQRAKSARQSINCCCCYFLRRGRLPHPHSSSGSHSIWSSSQGLADWAKVRKRERESWRGQLRSPRTKCQCLSVFADAVPQCGRQSKAHHQSKKCVCVHALQGQLWTVWGCE